MTLGDYLGENYYNAMFVPGGFTKDRSTACAC